MDHVSWSPDGRFLATTQPAQSNSPRTIDLWDASTGEVIDSYAIEEILTSSLGSLEWSADGRYLIAGLGGANYLYVFDMSGGQFELLNEISDVDERGFEDASISPDGSMIVGVVFDLERGYAFAWNPASGALLHSFPEEIFFESVHWSPDSRYFATISLCRGHCGEIYIWNADEFTYRTADSMVAEIYLLAWRPDGHRFASFLRSNFTSFSDCHLRIWSAWAEELIIISDDTVELPNSISWNSDGTLIASGGSSHGIDENLVHVWNANNGDLLLVIDETSDRVYSVDWSPEGNLLAAVGRDGTIRVWEVVNESE
jgi:WD40 repeat protein